MRKSDFHTFAFNSRSPTPFFILFLHSFPVSSRSCTMRWWQGYLMLWGVILAICFREIQTVLATMPYPTPNLYHAVYLMAYIFFLAILSVVLPGKIQSGAVLADNSRKKYKCNGLLVAGTVVSVFGAAVYNGKLNGTYVADNIVELFCVTNIYAISLSTYLFS